MIKIPDDVLAALCCKFGTSAEKIKYLGGGREDSDGTVFMYPESEKISVLKILAIPIQEADGLSRLEERIKFANFLGQNDIDLAYPELNAAGNLYETVHTDKHVFTAYKMSMREGYHPKPEEWTSDFYHAWGKVTGKMHSVTKQYPHWKRIPSNNKKTLTGWEEEINLFYSWCKDRDVKQKWLEMKERLADLPFNRDTFGFIHNDNHVQNVLWNKGGITLIDFDVANCHFFINDVAVTLQGLLFAVTGGISSPINNGDIVKAAVNDFMDGYEQENHLDDFWLRQIDTFVSYRRLLLFTVMQEWLDTQKEKKQMFKYLIENEPVIYAV